MQRILECIRPGESHCGGLGLVVAVIGAFAVGGCALAGSWRAGDAISLDDGTVSAISAITLSMDGRFTATETRDGAVVTSTGHYRWNGWELNLSTDGEEARTIPCRVDWRGSILIRGEDSGDGWIVLRRCE